MEQQQTGKRSIALPITLVILVFSLIGNVFLYSQFLQHKQENNFEAGQSIYEAGSATKQFVEELLPLLEALKQSKGLEERISLNFELGKMRANSSSVIAFAEEAERLSTDPQKINAELFSLFLEEKVSALQTIGRHAGPLNDEEQASIAELKGTFETMSGILKNFNTNIEGNRIAIIRLSSGIDWPELVEKLQQAIHPK